MSRNTRNGVTRPNINPIFRLSLLRKNVPVFFKLRFDEFIRVFFRENRFITFFGVWCLVGNIALFTYYINTARDKTAKGIFAVTLVYGIGVLLLKLFNK